MESYIPQICSTKQCITYCMDQDISIRMPFKAKMIINFDTTNPKIASFLQLMHIITKTNSYHRENRLKYYFIKFRRPSISNPKEIRKVWSSGLDCEVDT